MAFVFWALLIVSFFSTLFVIIKALQKKYHGWKSFFIPLAILNLVVFALFLTLILIASLTPHNVAGVGLAFVGLGLFIVGIIPVTIVDVLCILLFLIKPRPQKASHNQNY